MGQKELLHTQIFVEKSQRTEHLRQILIEDFTHLLESGGVVNTSGIKLDQPCDELVKLLPYDLQEQIETKRVLRVNISAVKSSLKKISNTERFASTRLYFFAQNSIQGLSYKELQHGSIVPIMVGLDGTKTIPTSADNHFPTFFVNRTKSILNHENIPGSHYRYATSILRDISNSRGLGNINGKVALEFINNSK